MATITNVKKNSYYIGSIINFLGIISLVIFFIIIPLLPIDFFFGYMFLVSSALLTTGGLSIYNIIQILREEKRVFEVISEKDKIQRKLKIKDNDLSNTQEKLDTATEEKKKEFNNLYSQINTLKHTVDILNGEKMQVSSDRDFLKGDVDDLQKKLKDRESENGSLRQDLKNAKQNVHRLEEIKNTEDEKKELDSKIQQLHIKAEELIQENKGLKQKIDQLKSQDNLDDETDSLTSRTENTNLKGFYDEFWPFLSEIASKTADENKILTENIFLLEKRLKKTSNQSLPEEVDTIDVRILSLDCKNILYILCNMRQKNIKLKEKVLKLNQRLDSLNNQFFKVSGSEIKEEVLVEDLDKSYDFKILSEVLEYLWKKKKEHIKLITKILMLEATFIDSNNQIKEFLMGMLNIQQQYELQLLLVEEVWDEIRESIKLKGKILDLEEVLSKENNYTPSSSIQRTPVPNDPTLFNSKTHPVRHRIS